MPILNKQSLGRYLQSRFGPETRLLSYKVIGKASSQGEQKRYGYGTPVKLTFRLEGRLQSAVLETMRPGPFGHEHMADRAQAILWDYDSYGRLPRHVKTLDVGAFDGKQALFSVAEAREFFVLNEWAEGASYHLDLERLAKGGALRALDRSRTIALAQYLAQIHGTKRRDSDLYKRRLRELIGHGECIMGLTDSYPKQYGFITEDLLRRVQGRSAFPSSRGFPPIQRIVPRGDGFFRVGPVPRGMGRACRRRDRNDDQLSPCLADSMGQAQRSVRELVQIILGDLYRSQR